jgi:hypothetical protein
MALKQHLVPPKGIFGLQVRYEHLYDVLRTRMDLKILIMVKGRENFRG